MTPVFKRRRWFHRCAWLIESTYQGGELCWFMDDPELGRTTWISRIVNAKTFQTKTETMVKIEALRRASL